MVAAAIIQPFARLKGLADAENYYFLLLGILFVYLCQKAIVLICQSSKAMLRIVWNKVCWALKLTLITGVIGIVLKNNTNTMKKIQGISIPLDELWDKTPQFIIIVLLLNLTWRLQFQAKPSCQHCAMNLHCQSGLITEVIRALVETRNINQHQVLTGLQCNAVDVTAKPSDHSQQRKRKTPSDKRPRVPNTRHSSWDSIDVELTDGSAEDLPQEPIVKVSAPNADTKCGNCGSPHPKDKCWVLEKKIRCFRCQQPGHIAIKCTQQRDRFQIGIDKRKHVADIDEEIIRLKKAIKNLEKLKNKPSNKTNQQGFRMSATPQ